MDQRYFENIVFTHGQSINRDATSPVTPRPDGDGKENTTSTNEPPGTRSATHRFQQPAFFDSNNRNSTDLALQERKHQLDVTAAPSSQHKVTFDNGGQDVYSQLEAVRKEKHKLEKKLSGLARELRTVTDEKMEMGVEMAVQNQVNRDLKKLLVASMGSDLQAQLENLSSERAQLAQDLENTIKTLATERETLERVNIQCDVWRSKFLGSRLQVDEAVTSRTRLDMALQEACFALKKTVEERDEIRTHMMQTQRLLHYLSNALQRTHSLSEDTKTSSNVLTLALLNEQMASMISKHLLGDVGHSQQKSTSQFEFVEWTSAEMLAKEILLNRQPSLKLEQLKALPSSAMSLSADSLPKTNIAQRFHPHTTYENLTVNCCKYCKGDIKLV
ncbi:golgin-45-like [Asterias rubens]|uniref:golgin-45-like n=1 Tax=Asterias rubens TaxID=7604 RepID=UPI0014552663|nr:golgin-45-like [Asterias rubens]